MKKAVLTSFMILCLLSTMLLMGLGFNIQTVRASGTIYIRADGSIDPPTALISTVDNITYTFMDNIDDSIVVERNNTVIDGAGYSVLGTEPFLYSKGIDLAGRKNVTLRNMSIEGFYYGVYLDFSSDNNIFGNIMTNNEYGIMLDLSSNNSIARNNITVNNGGGISLIYCSNNRVSGNKITANSWEGIYLLYSFDNNISGNDVRNNVDGIILVYSSINNVFRNNITANKGLGILLGNSSSNIILGNDLVENGDGIHLISSLGDLVYHNNFSNNTRQVYDLSWDLPIVPSSVTWDAGYPSGGNYWSDYAGNDTYSGPYQNESGYDWIGDSPYVIDENNQDKYPLMNPYAPETEEVRITYRKLLGKYDELLADHDKLNSTYYALLSNYTELQGGYDALNSSYNDLNATYNELKLEQEATLRKLSNTRDLMYGFIATTIIFIVTTVYFAIRKPKIEPKTQ